MAIAQYRNIVSGSPTKNLTIRLRPATANRYKTALLRDRSAGVRPSLALKRPRLWIGREFSISTTSSTQRKSNFFDKSGHFSQSPMQTWKGIAASS